LQDLQTAQGDYDRARASIRTAQAQIDQQQTTIAQATVRAPIDGVVLDRNVSVGQTVAATFQTPVLFTLASDLSKMQLQVDIDEADIGQVRVGQQASFTVDAFPQDHFAATLVSLRNAPKTVNNVVTYTGILSVDNRAHLLRPGMTATAEIITDRERNALLVPNGALRFTPLQSALKVPIPPLPVTVNGRLQGRVWLLKDGIPTPRDPRLGKTDGKSTVVLSRDVAPGDAAITDVTTSAPTTP
jgi:HlyD family secretion protein